jgi:hypothetical protein
VSQLREQLLGYLLGALEEDEQREIERKLAESPEVRDELARLKAALFPLEMGRLDSEPSSDLVERTCRLVAAHQRDREPDPSNSPSSTLTSSTPLRGRDPMLNGSSTHWLDTVVSIGVCTALALLFFPALLNSRELARRMVCQDNLRHFGVGIANYHHQYRSIPYIPLDGPFAFAGFYATTLRYHDLLDDDSRLFCPGGSRSIDCEEFLLPTPAMLEQAQAEELEKLRCSAGGDYGFHLGVAHGSRHCPPVLNGNSQCVIMSDAPDYHRSNFISSHHGGQGMNVLYADLRCVFVRGCEIAGRRGPDNLFLNHEKHIAAGLGFDDSVIAPSGMGPRVIPISRVSYP